jgi:hypothetical protein
MRELYSDLARLVGLGLMLTMGGCTAVRQPAAAGPVAHVVVVNLSDSEWQIAIAPAGGGEARVLRLQARASQKVELSAGDYAIEQTLLAGNPGPASTRRLSAKLDPGQTYRWRLVTLLSALPGDIGRERGDPGRE